MCKIGGHDGQNRETRHSDWRYVCEKQEFCRWLPLQHFRILKCFRPGETCSARSLDFLHKTNPHDMNM